MSDRQKCEHLIKSLSTGKKIKNKINLTNTHRAILPGLISFSKLINIFNNVPYAFSAALPVINLKPISDTLISRLR